MASKSKNKGSRFEYAIRDMFNKVFDSKEFARTPGSGAIMGRSNFAKRSGLSDAAKDTLSADLICPSWFPYSIEAKNYADKPSYTAMLSNSDSTLDGWLAEALFDAINFNKIPMLFFNTTRKGSYVAIPELIGRQLEVDNYMRYREFMIVPMATIEKNAHKLRDIASQILPSVIEWMEKSECVSFLNQLAESKKK